MAIFNKKRLVEQLKSDEGFKSKAYWDSKQFTIGYGTKARHPTEVLSKESAEKRLDSKVSEVEKSFDRIFKGHEQKFNDVRTEAFMNIIFNLGAGGLLEFRQTLSAIKNEDKVQWDVVGAELKDSKWYTQVGKRGKRLVEEVIKGTKV